MDTVKIRIDDRNIVELEQHDFLSSTVELARQYANAGYPDRYVIFTDTLTSHKKNDHSKKGIYLSLILRPSFFISQSGFLRIQSAAAFATALEQHVGEKVGIAWVSDLYCRGKKIGYTTVEGKLDEMSFFEYVIVTFSVDLPAKDYPPKLNDMVKQVFSAGKTSVYRIIAETVLLHFFDFYRKLNHKKIFLQPYNERFLLRGKRIIFLDNGKHRFGRVVGLNQEDGTLLIEYRNRTVTVSSPKSILLPKKLQFKK